MNRISRSRVRGARVRLAAAALLVGLLAIAGGAAHAVSAATTTITITSTQTPGATDGATLSAAGTGQKTYVFYSLNFVSQSSWTHVTLSDSRPVATLLGNAVALQDAAVVLVDGCPTAPTLADGGFNCSIDKLAPGVPLTINVVVQTPTSGDTLNVNPELAGDERANDRNTAKQDTFFTPLQWSPLTSDATNALTSYTNPTQTSTPLATDKHLCVGSKCAAQNPQWTETDVPAGPAPKGILVKMAERPFNTGECPGFVATAGLKCFGQISHIEAPAPGSPVVSFTCDPAVVFPGACASSLTFTVEVAAASLTSKVNLNKAIIFHDSGSGYAPVARCSSSSTSAADCVLSVVQLANHDIQWTVRGPDNGNWGGAG